MEIELAVMVAVQPWAPDLQLEFRVHAERNDINGLPGLLFKQQIEIALR